jgi:hypothetical protein
MYCYVHDCTSTLRIWNVCLHSNSVLLSARALRKILYLSSWQFHLCLVTVSLMTLSTRLWKLPKLTSKKQNIYNIWLHVLAHFQRTTCSQIYFRFSSYLLRKTHWFVILTTIGWFIVNIQSDLFWTLWKRVKTHVLSDQSVHITHTYCCVSKLSKFGAYLYSRVHNNTFLSLRHTSYL